MSSDGQKVGVLSIDAGTTSNRVVLFDGGAQPVAQVGKEFEQHYPQPGWVEHDATVIWRDVRQLLLQMLQRAAADGYTVAGISITNQRETIVVWDGDGEPVGNAIVWQDRRSAAICERLVQQGLQEPIQQKTGLVVDAYFSGSKLMWMLQHDSSLRQRAEQGTVKCGTIDSWLLYKLTGGAVHKTDYSNASRTMLYNINTLQWDDELLQAMNIPRAWLPQVCESSTQFGVTALEVLDGQQISIGGIAGDQQAALFGQRCYAVGQAKNTYGTGSFILMNIGDRPQQSQHSLLTTIAWGLNGTVTYALEGAVFVTGAAVQWLRDGISIIDNAAQSEQLAQSVDDTGGVYVVPAFVGLGAPYWDSYARGTIVGITRGTTRAHIVRATLEALAYQSNDVLQAMAQDAGSPITQLRVDGGAAANNFLMQFQSDIMDTEVHRPQVVESTALGSALLAGLSSGVWDSTEQLATMKQHDTVFTPSMPAQHRTELLQQWKRAVERARQWEQP